MGALLVIVFNRERHSKRMGKLFLLILCLAAFATAQANESKYECTNRHGDAYCRSIKRRGRCDIPGMKTHWCRYECTDCSHNECADSDSRCSRMAERLGCEKVKDRCQKTCNNCPIPT